MHYDLVILGAGTAGLMAAISAGETLRQTGISARIAIFEKNAQPGIKILATGGGRCNFTNSGSTYSLIQKFGRNGRFLIPALHQLDNQALRDFFTTRNVPSHEEHGGKIYPDSNQASSIVDALLRSIHELGIEIITGAVGTVTAIQRLENFHITTANNQTHTANQLLLATGGMSHPRMGTTGDGYRFAQSLGHSIITPRPAIVALLTQDEWPKSLQGLAVQDVEVKLPPHRKWARVSKGDLLFTHFGLSGPAILNPSEIYAELLETSPGGKVPLTIDFSPQHSQETWQHKMRNWRQRLGKKLLRTMLGEKLPRRLTEKLLELENIPQDQTCASLTASQIHRLIERIKLSRFTITGTRGFHEAMVTAGGVKLGEVDPRTMQSKIVPNLYLAGEVLDLTGPSGGYNLQLAFSTGALAGMTMAIKII
ncbi:MAG: NAD(P)/FAD-dependent oxidoreductase [Phycisphaerales bacterium]|nr:NAD(P)/FAD-dependent oxidoreductase [Phycisphaerales bacterium]